MDPDRKKRRFEDGQPPPPPPPPLLKLIPPGEECVAFIGNVPQTTTAETLVEFINGAALGVGLCQKGLEPALNVRLSARVHFAYVDCRDSDACNTLMNLSGIPFLGSNLKFGRPAQYTNTDTIHKSWQGLLGQPPLPPAFFKDPLTPNDPTISGQSTDQHTVQMRDVFVGNIPLDTSCDVIADFLNNTMYKLCLTKGISKVVIKNVRMSTRYCFVECLSLEEAVNMLNLNGVSFQGQVLAISRPQRFHKAIGPAFYNWDDLLTRWITGDLKVITAGQPSKCIEIRYIVTAQILSDDAAFDDMLDDCKQECEQFGTVGNIYSPRPDKDALASFIEKGDGGGFISTLGLGVGNLYVEMSSEQEARDVLIAIKGRTYADRVADVKYIASSDLPPLSAAHGTAINKPVVCTALTAGGIVDMKVILSGMRSLLTPVQLSSLRTQGYSY